MKVGAEARELQPGDGDGAPHWEKLQKLPSYRALRDKALGSVWATAKLELSKVQPELANVKD